jgi:hypothetical protein
MNALEFAARSFVVSPKAGRLLERHRATVLTLRAKDAISRRFKICSLCTDWSFRNRASLGFVENIVPRFSACDSSLNRKSNCRLDHNQFVQRHRR